VCKEEEKKKEKKKKFFCVDREREREIEREHVDTHENCKKKTHCSPKKEKLNEKMRHYLVQEFKTPILDFYGNLDHSL
jgi:hypothetical protein